MNSSQCIWFIPEHIIITQKYISSHHLQITCKVLKCKMLKAKYLWDLIQKTLHEAAVTPALQKMQYFCDVTLCHWLRSALTSEGTMSLQKLRHCLPRDTALHLKRHFQQTSVPSSDACSLPKHVYSNESKRMSTLLHRKPASSGISCERYHAKGQKKHSVSFMYRTRMYEIWCSHGSVYAGCGLLGHNLTF